MRDGSPRLLGEMPLWGVVFALSVALFGDSHLPRVRAQVSSSSSSGVTLQSLSNGSKLEVRRKFAFFKSHKTASTSICATLCQAFDCESDSDSNSEVFWFREHAEAFMKKHLKSSEFYEAHRERLETSSGFLGHVYNMRRRYKTDNKTGRHRGHSAPRFFAQTFKNYQMLYGKHVFVFTSLRDPVDHFVSSISFFSHKEPITDNNTLSRFLWSATDDVALHNPLAADFGLTTEADVAWFVRNYVYSCRVFFISLESIREGLSIAIQIITDGLHSLTNEVTVSHVMPGKSHHHKSFVPSPELLARIKGATKLDSALIASVEKVRSSKRCLFGNASAPA
uniref:Uncharacterized protein n=1 Tax=Pyramimonas obovata TaxID=1411642 RepID=A0A7S0WGI0_9CHLO|mmetsp:Transcript_24910/g.54251  ORF Transcript_24910/g.54251 Transcript_24910/m.54251 type:complete len:337 (+) Transcript_24910:171-1181(+)